MNACRALSTSGGLPDAGVVDVAEEDVVLEDEELPPFMLWERACKSDCMKFESPPIRRASPPALLLLSTRPVDEPVLNAGCKGLKLFDAEMPPIVVMRPPD